MRTYWMAHHAMRTYRVHRHAPCTGASSFGLQICGLQRGGEHDRVSFLLTAERGPEERQGRIVEYSAVHEDRVQHRVGWVGGDSV